MQKPQVWLTRSPPSFCDALKVMTLTLLSQVVHAHFLRAWKGKRQAACGTNACPDPQKEEDQRRHQDQQKKNKKTKKKRSSLCFSSWTAALSQLSDSINQVSKLLFCAVWLPVVVPIWMTHFPVEFTRGIKNPVGSGDGVVTVLMSKDN